MITMWKTYCLARHLAILDAHARQEEEGGIVLPPVIYPCPVQLPRWMSFKKVKVNVK